MKKSIGAKIVFPTMTVVVGTYDKAGRPNAMTAAWVGVCCSNPPCVAVSLREATYSYKSIVERKAFTINIPSQKYLKEADYFGIASGKDADKFSVAGLTPAKSDIVDAPYVKEFPFFVECALLHTIKIGLHTQFIGEIKDVKADEEVLGENEMPNIEKIMPMLFNPANGCYYSIGQYIGKAFSIGKQITK